MENHADRPEVAAALRGRDRRRHARLEDRRRRGALRRRPDDVERRTGRRCASRSRSPRSRSIARALAAARARCCSLAALVDRRRPSRRGRAVPPPSRSASSRRRPQTHGRRRPRRRDSRGARRPAFPWPSRSTALKRQMRARLDALEAEQSTLRTALDGLADAVFLLEGDIDPLRQQRRGPHLPDAGGRLARRRPRRRRAARVARRHDRGAPRLADSRSPPSSSPTRVGRTLRLLVVPLDAGREDGRTLVVVSDVTERARLDRVRRDFVANASHELKTPVAGIQLLAESAGDAAADGDVEQSLLFSAQIEAEAVRLERLVRDLLDLSRLETAAPSRGADRRPPGDRERGGRVTVPPRPGEGSSLDVDLSAIRGVDVFVAAEPTDVAVALDNLLDNAIAYTEAGGASIAVTASDAIGARHGRRHRHRDSRRGPPAHLRALLPRRPRAEAARAAGRDWGSRSCDTSSSAAAGRSSSRPKRASGTTFTRVAEARALAGRQRSRRSVPAHVHRRAQRKPRPAEQPRREHVARPVDAEVDARQPDRAR